MSTMRVYTREFRESAVGLVLSQGLSIRVAAEDLGMPYHTLHSWVRDKRRARRKTIVNAPRKERRLAIGGRAVVRIHAESRQIYSSPKITRELPKLGLAAHRNTVSRIMQECGIGAKYVQKYRPTTTRSAHAHSPSPDLLECDLTADGPNKKWLCDITCIPTDEGFLNLAGVMLAWSMSNTLHATIATDALTISTSARTTRRAQQSLNGSRCGTNESESTAHSATSAPKRSRRPRGSDRIVMGVHDECAGPSRQFLQADTPGRQLHRIITASAD